MILCQVKLCETTEFVEYDDKLEFDTHWNLTLMINRTLEFHVRFIQQTRICELLPLFFCNLDDLLKLFEFTLHCCNLIVKVDD